MRSQREARRQAGQSGEQVGSVERRSLAGRNAAARHVASRAAKANGVRLATGVDAERSLQASRNITSISIDLIGESLCVLESLICLRSPPRSAWAGNGVAAGGDGGRILPSIGVTNGHHRMSAPNGIRLKLNERLPVAHGDSHGVVEVGTCSCACRDDRFSRKER